MVCGQYSALSHGQDAQAHLSQRVLVFKVVIGADNTGSKVWLRWPVNWRVEEEVNSKEPPGWVFFASVVGIKERIRRQTCPQNRER